MDPSFDLSRSEQIYPLSPSAPSDDIHYALSVPTSATILLPAISRLAPPPSRPAKIRRRPSTASPAQDKRDFLPPAPSMGDLTPSAYSSIADVCEVGRSSSSAGRKDRRSASCEDRSIQDMSRQAQAAVAGLRAEASRLAGLGACSIPLDCATRSH